MLKDGDFTHAELMMGTNQDEGRWVYTLYKAISKDIQSWKDIEELIDADIADIYRYLFYIVNIHTRCRSVGAAHTG